MTSLVAKFNGIMLLSGVCGVRAGAPIDAPLWAAKVINLFTTMIFGYHVAQKLPSPVHTPAQALKIPHLLIHCKNEAFGIRPIEAALDVLLCSKHYAASLRKCGVPVQLCPVESNHWSVLNSKAPSDALHNALVVEAWPLTANS